MKPLEEFYNLMIEYPWCTLFTFLGMLVLVANFSPIKIYNINHKDKDNKL